MNLLSDVVELRKRDRVSTRGWAYHHDLINHLYNRVAGLESENKDLREVIYQHGKRIQKLEEARNEKEMQLRH